jgi:cell shape-determining protein MreC
VPRKFVIAYLSIFSSLLFLMSLSHPATEKLRGSAISFLAPLWETLIEFKYKITHPGVKKEQRMEGEIALSLEEQLSHLQVENQLLKNTVNELKEVNEKQGILSPLSHHSKVLSLKAIPAHIIFRPLDTWNSSCWINVGESDNQRYGEQVIAKNSPVLVSDSVVGVIDYVGHHQSRVRLITDSGLSPSVRVLRGSSLYLAKGELRGVSGPAWRGQSQLLKGTGFNYDFDDDKGEARDLRTGKILSQPNSTPIPILKVDDLLVTTGMDGVFPPNLQVARVSKIELLKEGDYFYELEAKPTAGSLDELSVVFVTAPVGYSKQDQP